VVASFSTFPIGGGALDAVNTMRLHELGSVVFRYGLWIALPLVGMLIFINIVLGIVSRIAPQMNAFAIGFPVTLSAGLVGIAFTLPMLDTPVAALLRLATGLFTG
jgi:flagellar biosynthetic protein FliR